MQKIYRPLSLWEIQYYSMVIGATVAVVFAAMFLFLQTIGLSPDGSFLKLSDIGINESKGFIANMIVNIIPN